jgi:hypothetical protein
MVDRTSFSNPSPFIFPSDPSLSDIWLNFFQSWAADFSDWGGTLSPLCIVTRVCVHLGSCAHSGSLFCLIVAADTIFVSYVQYILSTVEQCIYRVLLSV